MCAVCCVNECALHVNECWVAGQLPYYYNYTPLSMLLRITIDHISFGIRASLINAWLSKRQLICTCSFIIFIQLTGSVPFGQFSGVLYVFYHE